MLVNRVFMILPDAHAKLDNPFILPTNRRSLRDRRMIGSGCRADSTLFVVPPASHDSTLVRQRAKPRRAVCAPVPC